MLFTQLATAFCLIGLTLANPAPAPVPAPSVTSPPDPRNLETIIGAHGPRDGEGVRKVLRYCKKKPNNLDCQGRCEIYDKFAEGDVSPGKWLNKIRCVATRPDTEPFLF